MMTVLILRAMIVLPLATIARFLTVVMCPQVIFITFSRDLSNSNLASSKAEVRLSNQMLARIYLMLTQESLRLTS